MAKNCIQNTKQNGMIRDKKVIWVSISETASGKGRRRKGETLDWSRVLEISTDDINCSTKCGTIFDHSFLHSFCRRALC